MIGRTNAGGSVDLTQTNLLVDRLGEAVGYYPSPDYTIADLVGSWNWSITTGTDGLLVDNPFDIESDGIISTFLFGDYTITKVNNNTFNVTNEDMPFSDFKLTVIDINNMDYELLDTSLGETGKCVRIG